MALFCFERPNMESILLQDDEINENIIEENVIVNPISNTDRIVFTQEDKQEFEQCFHELMQSNGYNNNLQLPNYELQFINKLMGPTTGLICDTYFVNVNEENDCDENKKYADLIGLFTQFGQFRILDDRYFEITNEYENRQIDNFYFYFVFHRDTFDNWLLNYRENRDKIQVLK